MIFFQRLNNSNENLMGSVLVVPVVRSETICVPVTWVRFHFVWWKKRKNAHLKTTRKSLKDSSAIFSKSSLTFSCVRRKNRAATTFLRQIFLENFFLIFCKTEETGFFLAKIFPVFLSFWSKSFFWSRKSRSLPAFFIRLWLARYDFSSSTWS